MGSLGMKRKQLFEVYIKGLVFFHKSAKKIISTQKKINNSFGKSGTVTTTCTSVAHDIPKVP
jgi:hypothetical protein